MGEVKWIKLNVDIFDDEKIKMISTLPDGRTIQLVWLKLLCLAGKCNEGGLLMVTKEMPYTDEMLAKRFDEEISVIQRALTIFQRLEMLDVVENIYLVSNWTKHQSTKSLEDIKEQNRERQRRYRDKKKQELLEEKENNVTSNVTSDVTVTQICSYSTSDNLNNQLPNNLNSFNNPNSINKQIDINDSIKNIIKAWNELSDIGIKPVRGISSGSKRNDSLRARIREYGEETVVEAIGKIRESEFLRGNNSKGWMITFDWFLLPSNFQKVLEGNYDNRNHSSQQDNTELKGSELFMAIAKGEA